MMLRFKVWASVVPLFVVALLARSGLLSTSHPCIAIADTAVEIADLPWHADLHVAFTEDPRAATVRVQITEDAETADFAIVDDGGVDDVDVTEAGACEANPASHAVTVSKAPARGMPVIYLADQGPADYRIFVRSKTFSLRDAAALVVGASIARSPIEAAAL
jgi:hypothetical protein